MVCSTPLSSFSSFLSFFSLSLSFSLSSSFLLLSLPPLLSFLFPLSSLFLLSLPFLPLPSFSRLPCSFHSLSLFLSFFLPLIPMDISPYLLLKELSLLPLLLTSYSALIYRFLARIFYHYSFPFSFPFPFPIHLPPLPSPSLSPPRFFPFQSSLRFHNEIQREIFSYSIFFLTKKKEREKIPFTKKKAKWGNRVRDEFRKYTLAFFYSVKTNTMSKQHEKFFSNYSRNENYINYMNSQAGELEMKEFIKSNKFPVGFQRKSVSPGGSKKKKLPKIFKKTNLTLPSPTREAPSFLSLQPSMSSSSMTRKRSKSVSRDSSMSRSESYNFRNNTKNSPSIIKSEPNISPPLLPLSPFTVAVTNNENIAYVCFFSSSSSFS